jgi:uncharacterized protein involved in copper resistance
MRAMSMSRVNRMEEPTSCPTEARLCCDTSTRSERPTHRHSHRLDVCIGRLRRWYARGGRRAAWQADVWMGEETKGVGGGWWGKGEHEQTQAGVVGC